MKYEKWSLGYWILKQYVRFASWLILKETVITGRDKIPGNKPVVFAPNHQNALSDPMAVLLNTRFQPVWLARADIFGKTKILDVILKFMKIIPVYRLRDGKENLDKNQETFSVSIKVLENNFALALFPEAAHTFKRQMIPHKKAVPRIVFMAEEQTGDKLDIQIIPTGIHYSHYWKFNRTLIVNFGDPVPVADFMEKYHQNPNAATIALKSKIHDAILPLIINIKSKIHYEAFECIRVLYGNHYLKRQNKKQSVLNRFHSDRQLVNLLDNLEGTHPSVAGQLSTEATGFCRQIKSLGLRFWLLEAPEKHREKLAINSLLLLTSLPIFIFGFVFNAIPFYLIDKLVRKKIKDKSFWSSFFLAGGIIVFPLYYLILLFAISPLISYFWLKIAFLASLPFAGKVAFKWYILFRKTAGILKFLRLKSADRKTYKQLLASKDALFKKLDALLNPL